jgi:hypothetical protein
MTWFMSSVYRSYSHIWVLLSQEIWSLHNRLCTKTHPLKWVPPMGVVVHKLLPPLKWMEVSMYTWTDVSQASSEWKLKVVVLVDGCLWQQFKTVDWLASTWIGRSMHSWEIDVFVSPIGNTIWRWNKGIYILVHVIVQHIFIQIQLLYVAE